MSRWFRHYAGMMRDDKLVRVALKSRQTVERVVWVWGAILESAAEIDDGGRFELDPAEAAYFLRADEADIERIVVVFGELGRVHEGRVAKWRDRQFQSDRSAERQQRYRDKRKSERDSSSDENGDVAVTPASRHGDAPKTETEADTTTEPKGPVVVRAKAPPEHVQILDCLKTVLSDDRAKAVVEHRKKMKKPLGLHAAQLLVGQFSQIAEPDKAADLMVMRGWQGCEPEWCANAGLKMAQATPHCASSPSQTFVARDSPEWLRRVASGHKPGLCKFYPEHQAEGWLFTISNTEEAA